MGLETGACFFWVLGTTVGVFGGDFLAPYHLFVSSLLFSLTPLFGLALAHLAGKLDMVSYCRWGNCTFLPYLGIYLSGDTSCWCSESPLGFGRKKEEGEETT